ncbi:MAG: hypothetical protein JOZ69_15490 [Myxococcales bacterium]|nr:hypothetical protein [Myxococcales bacterium]
MGVPGTLPAPAPGPLPSPAARERAAALRATGSAACEAARWDECERRLDEAKALDPGGEDEARVRQWRARIAAARAASEHP